MITSLVIAIVCFLIGVITAARVKHVAAVATSTINTVAADVADQYNAYNEYLHCILLPTVATVAAVAMATVRAGAADVVTHVAADVWGMIEVFTSVIELLVEASTYDLAEPTSMYSLNVAAGSGEFAAGEYLVRDNGQWRNVTLTAYARALMGTSADVIALQPATVVNASGSYRAWHVAVPEFGLVPFAPIA